MELRYKQRVKRALERPGEHFPPLPADYNQGAPVRLNCEVSDGDLSRVHGRGSRKGEGGVGRGVWGKRSFTRRIESSSERMGTVESRVEGGSVWRGGVSSPGELESQLKVV
jgi:hypothetical protein